MKKRKKRFLKCFEYKIKKIELIFYLKSSTRYNKILSKLFLTSRWSNTFEQLLSSSWYFATSVNKFLKQRREFHKVGSHSMWKGGETEKLKMQKTEKEKSDLQKRKNIDA